MLHEIILCDNSECMFFVRDRKPGLNFEYDTVLIKFWKVPVRKEQIVGRILCDVQFSGFIWCTSCKWRVYSKRMFLRVSYF